MKTATVSVMVKMKNSTMETIWWMVTVSVGERERGYAAEQREIVAPSHSGTDL